MKKPPVKQAGEEKKDEREDKREEKRDEKRLEQVRVVSEGFKAAPPPTKTYTTALDQVTNNMNPTV